MQAQSLFDDLTRRGIELKPLGDQLVVAPASRLTDDDRQAIRALKADLLALLARISDDRETAALGAEPVNTAETAVLVQFASETNSSIDHR